MSRPRDPCPLLSQPYKAYIEREDASKNMARFYAMDIEPTLFGEVCLVRRWGRIGTQGRMMAHSFKREEDAVALFLELLLRKRKLGYRPRHGQPKRLQISRSAFEAKGFDVALSGGG